MKEGVENTIKFKKLKRRLRLPEWQVIGLLESIWKLTRTSAKAGDIGRFSNEDIADCLEYDDDPDELVKSLVDCGWVDEDKEFRLVIHDWSDHVPNYLKGNFTKHGKQFVDQVIRNRPGLLSRPDEAAKQLPSKPDEATKQAGGPPAKLPPSTVQQSQDNPSEVQACNVQRVFTSPTPSEVSGFIEEHRKMKPGWPRCNLDADQFVDHYDAQGWIGGNGIPITDWKAMVRKWGNKAPDSSRGDQGGKSQQTMEEFKQATESIAAKRDRQLREAKEEARKERELEEASQ